MRRWLLSIPILLACRREEQRVVPDPPSSNSASSSASPAPKPKQTCPPGMVLVEGDGQKTMAFCMDRTETTVDQYSRCVADKACDAPRLHTESSWECTSGVPKASDHPVTCSSYADAVKFCRWSGKRVPTATEWGWAAHGGSRRTKYPWGDSGFGPNVCLSGVSEKQTGTCPVGVEQHDSTPEGVMDLVGNATEWVSGDPSYADAGGAECGAECCSAGARGTSTSDTAPTLFGSVRPLAERPCTFRPTGQFGFRCVAPPAPAGTP